MRACSPSLESVLANELSVQVELSYASLRLACTMKLLIRALEP